MKTSTFTEMKQQAQAKLAAKKDQGVDQSAITAWENCLAGGMPLFFTNTSAKATLTVAVAAYQELAASQAGSRNEGITNAASADFINPFRNREAKASSGPVASSAPLAALPTASGPFALKSPTKPAPASSPSVTASGFVASVTATMPKAEFDRLSNRDKMRFSTNGGRIVEGPGNAGFVAAQIATMTKPKFDALTPRDKMSFSTNGGKIVD